MKMKKCLALIIAGSMSIAMTSAPAMACTTGSHFPVEKNDTVVESSVATKTAEALENAKYQVEIQVPGEDTEERHDHVIVMVDGSYSTDDDWDKTKAAILKIGEAVLGGNSHLSVTTFGIAANTVVEDVKTLEELEHNLPELPGGLLDGRSATNCEVGFDYIGEFIEAHQDEIENAYVIYISDGEVNTDESTYQYYNWKENSWLRFSLYNIGKMSISDELESVVNSGKELSHAYKTVFGDEVYSAEEFNAISEDEAIRFVDTVWDDVYEYCGLDKEQAYSISYMEKAFLKYDEENNTHIQEAFYYTAYGRPFPNKVERTISAAKKVADKVNALYLVDSNSETAWMSSLAEYDKTEFYVSGSVDNIVSTLDGVLSNLSYIPYSDVIVTDYMSKWVNLDKSTIKVVDNTSGETIWNAVDGWLISENHPTAKENPVEIEEVSKENYADGGNDVIGNRNGKIYKLTWYVKDGAMTRSDNYSLIYEVEVDELEFGFKYNVKYPANGITTIKYIDGENEEITENISVPSVSLSKSSCEKPNKPSCDNKPEKPNCDSKPDNKPGCGGNGNVNPPTGNDCNWNSQKEKPNCDVKPDDKPSCGGNENVNPPTNGDCSFGNSMDIGCGNHINKSIC